MENVKDIKLRSEEVQEILTRVPHWMIRWGTIVVFAIILLLFFVSWFIEYPDVISTEITITTAIPPEKLIARTSGKIEAILVKDHDFIKTNTTLAIIESSANYNDVFFLKSVLDTIDLDKSIFPFELFHGKQFGDIESDFAAFQKESIAENLNLKLKPFQVEVNAQSYESIQLKERLGLLESQKSIHENEMELQKIDLNRYESLFKKGIIASQEFEKQKLNYLQVLKNYKNILGTILQLKSSLNELNRNAKTTQINQNKENINLERSLIQAFYRLKKSIKDWELNHVLRSSIDGKVTYLQIWYKNQTVTSGENIFAVIPNAENNYIGKVKAIARSSGKIKVGQKVNIRLSNFPDREFGILKGKIKTISLTPDQDGFVLIDVILPRKLETSYHKTIPFLQEMKGNAEIITEDLRLLERILYQFREIFRK